MTAIDVGATMQAIADELVSAGVTKKAYGWPNPSVTAGSAIVGYPEELEFDATFGRGSDRAVFPVWVIVGKAVERTARDAISAFITGATGVKDALDGDLSGAVQTARVTDCQIEEIAVGDVAYLSAKLLVEVFS